MQILYLDSSGDTGAPKKGSSRYYVLAGISIDPANWHTMAKRLKDIVDSTFEPIGVIPAELHYFDLINNRHPYNKIDRKQLADSVFKLIADLPVVLFAMVLDKHAHWKKYSEPWLSDTHMMAAMTTRFEKFLRRMDDQLSFLL